jgi:hypothetical protein
MGRTRIYTAVLSVVLVPAGIGVVAVHASPTCQRFVRTYVTVPVRNRVSKATELAWAKWRVGHPNWKPKPGVIRPKYKMTREEAVKKVDIACDAPTVPTTMDKFFTPADFDGPPPAADLPPMESTQITFPDSTPPEVAEEIPPVAPGSPNTPDAPGLYIPPYIPPIFGGGSPPAQTVPPPILPPPPGLVPEPASFLLVALGMLSGGVLWMRRGWEPGSADRV